jgi:hypothetical protein
VTTSESPLLYVFAFLVSDQVDLGNRIMPRKK